MCLIKAHNMNQIQTYRAFTLAYLEYYSDLFVYTQTPLYRIITDSASATWLYLTVYSVLITQFWLQYR